MMLTRQVCEAVAAAVARRGGRTLAFERLGHFGEGLSAARFRLGNGLRVVVAPDASAPVFAYQSWFGVGSKHEDPGATGLAHLFEHLMFKSTSTHPAGTFDREMERRGAQTNAATWVDWTYYTEALGTRGDNLETVIAFESDRMHNLRLDEDTFRSELEVVKNERRMSVEDSVPGQLAEVLMAEAFRVHPYRWPTIGAMAHLEAMQVAELTAFYRRYYAPDNATLVVVGDVDVEHVLAAVSGAYGALPAAMGPRAPLPVEPAQAGPRLRCFKASTEAPQMLVGYRAPAQSGEDFPALEMLTEILVGGDSARLYRALVTDQQVCTEVSGSLHPFAEPGLVEFSLALRPGQAPERVLAALEEELARLAGGVEAWEVDKSRHGLEVSLYETLSEVEGAAEMLGHFETTEGDFALAFAQSRRRQGLDGPQLAEVAGRIFRPERRTAAVAEPR